MEEFGNEVRIGNDSVEITVAPDRGLSLISICWRGMEILDKRSKADFLAVRKGLGPLILPHFNQFASAPRVDKQAFPHIAALESRGVKHPFQHGIGRYVPWQFEVRGDEIRGVINGDMTCNGYSLAELNGYDFKAAVGYSLISDGLEIAFDVRGDQPVAAGIHFYYDLVERAKASVVLPGSCLAGEKRLHLEEPLDRSFPMKIGLPRTEAICTLTTPRYSLVTTFPTGGPPEGSFDTLVVFSPADATFACIEPVSYRVGEQNEKNHFSGSIRLNLAPPATGH